MFMRPLLNLSFFGFRRGQPGTGSLPMRLTIVFYYRLRPVSSRLSGAVERAEQPLDLRSIIYYRKNSIRQKGLRKQYVQTQLHLCARRSWRDFPLRKASCLTTFLLAGLADAAAQAQKGVAAKGKAEVLKQKASAEGSKALPTSAEVITKPQAQAVDPIGEEPLEDALTFLNPLWQARPSFISARTRR
jgi:hypothetical protein